MAQLTCRFPSGAASSGCLFQSLKTGRALVPHLYVGLSTAYAGRRRRSRAVHAELPGAPQVEAAWTSFKNTLDRVLSGLGPADASNSSAADNGFFGAKRMREDVTVIERSTEMPETAPPSPTTPGTFLKDVEFVHPMIDLDPVSVKRAAKKRETITVSVIAEDNRFNTAVSKLPPSLQNLFTGPARPWTIGGGVLLLLVILWSLISRLFGKKVPSAVLLSESTRAKSGPSSGGPSDNAPLVMLGNERLAGGGSKLEATATPPGGDVSSTPQTSGGVQKKKATAAFKDQSSGLNQAAGSGKVMETSFTSTTPPGSTSEVGRTPGGTGISGVIGATPGTPVLPTGNTSFVGKTPESPLPTQGRGPEVGMTPTSTPPQATGGSVGVTSGARVSTSQIGETTPQGKGGDVKVTTFMPSGGEAAAKSGGKPGKIEPLEANPKVSMFYPSEGQKQNTTDKPGPAQKEEKTSTKGRLVVNEASPKVSMFYPSEGQKQSTADKPGPAQKEEKTSTKGRLVVNEASPKVTMFYPSEAEKPGVSSPKRDSQTEGGAATAEGETVKVTTFMPSQQKDTPPKKEQAGWKTFNFFKSPSEKSSNGAPASASKSTPVTSPKAADPPRKTTAEKKTSTPTLSEAAASVEVPFAKVGAAEAVVPQVPQGNSAGFADVLKNGKPKGSEREGAKSGAAGQVKSPFEHKTKEESLQSPVLSSTAEPKSPFESSQPKGPAKALAAQLKQDKAQPAELQVAPVAVTGGLSSATVALAEEKAKGKQKQELKQAEAGRHKEQEAQANGSSSSREELRTVAEEAQIPVPVWAESNAEDEESGADSDAIEKWVEEMQQGKAVSGTVLTKREKDRRKSLQQALKDFVPAAAVGIGAAAALAGGVDGYFETVGFAALTSFFAYDLLWSGPRQKLLDEIKSIRNSKQLWKFLRERDIVKDLF